jgi:hypothetical protein
VLPFTGRPVGAKRTQQGSGPRRFSSEIVCRGGCRRCCPSGRLHPDGRECEDVSGSAGVASSGHASKGIPQEPTRALHLLPQEVPTINGDQRWPRTDGRAVLRTHSTGEGGEPQGTHADATTEPAGGKGGTIERSDWGPHGDTPRSRIHVHTTQSVNRASQGRQDGAISHDGAPAHARGVA